MTGALEDESSDESALVASLCAGDEAAFARLVDRYTPSMLRVARGYVRSHQTAEEVVQEAWIALIRAISKFEGRSSLRTWLFTVMINIAKTRGVRERRTFDAEVAAFTGGTVDAALFRGPARSHAGFSAAEVFGLNVLDFVGQLVVESSVDELLEGLVCGRW